MGAECLPHPALLPISRALMSTTAPILQTNHLLGIEGLSVSEITALLDDANIPLRSFSPNYIELGVSGSVSGSLSLTGSGFYVSDDLHGSITCRGTGIADPASEIPPFCMQGDSLPGVRP